MITAVLYSPRRQDAVGHSFKWQPWLIVVDEMICIVHHVLFEVGAQSHPVAPPKLGESSRRSMLGYESGVCIFNRYNNPSVDEILGSATVIRNHVSCAVSSSVGIYPPARTSQQ